MLELRPSCEHCSKPLPADSVDARICSFECTFCSNCVDTILDNVCPNCGGGFCQRPVRPASNLHNGASLERFPASQQIIHKLVDQETHDQFSASIRDIPPARR